MPQSSIRYYAKTSRRRRGHALATALRLGLTLAGALYLCWLILSPSLSGAVGRWVATRIFRLLGQAAYLAPVFIVNALAKTLREQKPQGGGVLAGSSLICLASAASLMALGASWFAVSAESGGGILGNGLASGLSNALGGFGAFLLSAAVVLISAQFVFGLRWSEISRRAAGVIMRDLQRWRRARAQLKTLLERSPQGDAAVADAASAPAPVEIIAEKPSHPARRAQAPKPALSDKKRHFELPPIGLLHPPPTGTSTGKPLESEIKTAILDLERTFRDFQIEARVSGWAPGPVITRYEVAPAPGVKISSIVTLQNDIALALKAKGIRIIAPIPGKAAVGIEIPNARPALVVLRDVLESPAIAPDAPLLTFALGLSSSGQPLAADLQKMPHLLVAGATNSGKSVFIHSLILSILYRARPDEVKFMLIDPKRLELTFYEGIPHLFDPIVPADKVSVITNPKGAANSLANLVKIMESRYQRFQLYGSRNIDGYNKEADKRGEPREYFIVVVIDELADLMLVAGGKVEENIQRLAQMARAVGIHMVLATQRPSVDIITGVIKANLPCRVAMQVISQVDSKVILDIMGAETLQGRGDMLYKNAGAQLPERCQGAYVTEDEIAKIVAHLRGQGLPDYPELETIPKPGEADLASFGVTPLEFSQALKLVLERRRVSQDLLKSQFGSSARATNLLSLLEVKDFIHKPEGSNRWEIHFDKIEDCLSKDFPQVPLNDPSR